MIAGLICVASLATLVQFVFYCRSALASARESEPSDQVLEVAGLDDRMLAAEDFEHFLELVRLCPEHDADRTEISAVARYYRALDALRSATRELMPSVSAWAERERKSCAHFAAVVLDRSISSSRNLFAYQAADRL